MAVKKSPKKRITITFQPDADVLEMLEKANIPKRERTKIINQALKERGQDVLKRHEKAKRLFQGAPLDKDEGTH